MSRSALIGEAVTPGGVRRVAVVILEGKISAVVEPPFSEELPDDRREVSGLICPGFIDLQINGSFGIDVGPDAAALEVLSARLPETGTTSFLPTATSWPSDRYGPFLDAVKAASPGPGARILGAHLEGPFLSPGREGAPRPGQPPSG